ncbi:hypothetical protein D1AOALGA4SA_8 [Olavius algarvensis Delta 1 endosymbiont]|nr:hypothetical protein D1AOALGA4SA_8 [Olavius algarvensis Delta 1 endosymbiont]
MDCKNLQAPNNKLQTNTNNRNSKLTHRLHEINRMVEMFR